MLPVGRKHTPVLLCYPRVREITTQLPRVENMWQLEGSENLLALALKWYTVSVLSLSYMAMQFLLSPEQAE